MASMIQEITPEEVIALCREILDLPASQSGLDDSLLAGLLRRAADIFCPCSRAVLRSVVMENCRFLVSDEEKLRATLDDLVEELIVSGDFLELQDVTTADIDAKKTWIFSAPPSFVVRRSGSVFLTGIVPDQALYLPQSLHKRVIYARTTRYIEPEIGENLGEELADLGLRQLPEAVWLKAPAFQKPEEFLEKYTSRLNSLSQCAPVEGLMILDSSKKVAYYKGRWTGPAQQSGFFIARRPQEYGPLTWCFVQIENGVLQRLMDLPIENYRWRGCDAAWHLQLVIDYCQGQPQKYRRTETQSGVRFDFFSPVPSWAERRLMILGEKRASDKSLFAYNLPAKEAEEEERWLQDHLWLTPVQEH